MKIGAVQPVKLEHDQPGFYKIDARLWIVNTKDCRRLGLVRRDTRRWTIECDRGCRLGKAPNPALGEKKLIEHWSIEHGWEPTT